MKMMYFNFEEINHYLRRINPNQSIKIQTYYFTNYVDLYLFSIPSSNSYKYLRFSLILILSNLLNIQYTEINTIPVYVIFQILDIYNTFIPIIQKCRLDINGNHYSNIFNTSIKYLNIINL